jgi:hypothetical protein
MQADLLIRIIRSEKHNIFPAIQTIINKTFAIGSHVHVQKM